MEDYKKVLDFWFEDTAKQFKKDPLFDQEIRDKFLDLHTKAMNNELDAWKEKPESMLALIIILDQFSRNMFRDTPRAFASDKKALELAKEAISKEFHLKVQKGETFFYMPFMHSEVLEDQMKCIELFSLKPGYKMGLVYAKKHMVIIERFRRFPHRNKILGRESTPEEVEFLKGPDSSF